MFEIKTRYCSFCTEKTDHEIPNEVGAPDAICQGCQRER